MENITQTEGYKKAQEQAEKLKGETEAKKEEKALEAVKVEKELATNRDYSKYINMGMKNISAEDIRPPVMFLVQGNIDKTELVDDKGVQCPDGHFYIKSFKQVIKEVRGYMVWVRKAHWTAPAQNPTESDERWDGSRMYRAIFIRQSDMQPIAVTFKKSSLGGLNDLLTYQTSQNLPMFLVEVNLQAVLTTNKNGQSYFKAVADVVGKEDDVEVMDKLFKLASGYDRQNEVRTDEDGATDQEAEEALGVEG